MLKLIISFLFSYAQNIKIRRHSEYHSYSDKELDILLYSMPSYVIIQKSYTLLKMVRFLAHPVYKTVFVLFLYNFYTQYILDTSRN